MLTPMARPADQSLPPVLPVGTAIVTITPVIGSDAQITRPRGSVGVITAAGIDQYRVRFPGGEEATIGRDDFEILSRYQALATGATQTTDAVDLYQHVIYRCVVGSRAYGLSHDESDTDRRGVYLPPAELHWSLFGVPEQLEVPGPRDDEVYWELQKFLTLALKANPNVLEVLHSPLVEYVTPLGEELLALRSRFLSRMVYQTYNGYVMSQFKKLEQDIRTRGEIKWKHAMHMVRLLLGGIRVLREGIVPLDVGEHRDRLIALRDGEMLWEQISAWRLKLHEEFERAYAATALPELPDYEAANAFLIRARRSMVT